MKIRAVDGSWSETYELPSEGFWDDTPFNRVEVDGDWYDDWPRAPRKMSEETRLLAEHAKRVGGYFDVGAWEAWSNHIKKKYRSNVVYTEDRGELKRVANGYTATALVMVPFWYRTPVKVEGQLGNKVVLSDQVRPGEQKTITINLPPNAIRAGEHDIGVEFLLHEPGGRIRHDQLVFYFPDLY